MGGTAFSFGLRLLIHRIKERTTYRQTGYAAPWTGLENRQSLIIAVLFTLLFLLVNAYLTIRGPQRLLQSSAIPGLIFTFIFGWTGYLVKLSRFYYLALASLLGGLVLVWLRIESMSGTGILCAVAGVILLVNGFRTRRAYLRHHPSLPQGSDGE